jgi:hypothetical protein
MANVSRYFVQRNTTGGLDPHPRIKGGTNVAVEIIEKLLTLAEIGTTAGKTQDGTVAGDGAVGLFLGEFEGPPVVTVLGYSLQRQQTADNVNLYYFVQSKVGFSIINTPKGTQKLYVVDLEPDDENKMAANDYLIVEVVIGHVPGNAPDNV